MVNVKGKIELSPLSAVLAADGNMAGITWRANRRSSGVIALLRSEFPAILISSSLKSNPAVSAAARA